MTALTEPFPPWLRDLNRFFNSDGTASTFVPPADVLVDEDGVTVYMAVPGVGSDHLDEATRRRSAPSTTSRTEGSRWARWRSSAMVSATWSRSLGGTPPAAPRSSVPPMRAERHEVVVDEDLADRAAKLLRSAV